MTCFQRQTVSFREGTPYTAGWMMCFVSFGDVVLQFPLSLSEKNTYPKIFQSPQIQAPNTAEFGPPGRANVPHNGGAVLQHLSPKMVG